MPARGRVLVNTGDGKGKTTAAFGTAFRAAGHGMEVAVVQFIKGSWNYGEVNAAERFPNIKVSRIGSGYTWMAEDPAVPRDLARKAWSLCLELAHSDAFDLLIMDELNCAVAQGFIDSGEVVSFLKDRPSRLSVIITGRGADAAVIAQADTVTEMRSVKHAFDDGVPARKGIEY